MIYSSLYDESVNTYKVKCGGSLEMWETSGWIVEQDPYGWFMWYCRFYLGRYVKKLGCVLENDLALLSTFHSFIYINHLGEVKMILGKLADGKIVVALKAAGKTI